jgi:hypothetical protein
LSQLTEILIILFIVFVGYVVWKYWTLAIGAGYDPTPRAVVDTMLDLAEVKAGDVLYDLGSGDGRILIAAAKSYDASAVGIEVDPFRFIFSWCAIRLARCGDKVKVRFGNLFATDIRSATVITLFLFGPANKRLKRKFQKELNPGVRIVSYMWPIEGWECEDTLPDEQIYLYRTT